MGVLRSHPADAATIENKQSIESDPLVLSLNIVKLQDSSHAVDKDLYSLVRRICISPHLADCCASPPYELQP